MSQFYNSLINVVNENREGFFQQERALQAINKQHENLLNKWPTSFYNKVFNRSSFNYLPITSTRTQEVEKTNKDDDTKVF